MISLDRVARFFWNRHAQSNGLTLSGQREHDERVIGGHGSIPQGPRELSARDHASRLWKRVTARHDASEYLVTPPTIV